MVSFFKVNNLDQQADIINWATNNIGPQSGNASVVEAHGWFYNEDCNIKVLTSAVGTGGTGTFAAGYSPGEVLNFSGGSSTSVGNVAVRSVKMGTCNIVNAGNNFTVGDTFTWGVNGPGAVGVVTVATANAVGSISTVTITKSGRLHNFNTTNSTTFGSKVTANAVVGNAVFAVRWDLGDIVIANPGDYITIPDNPVSLTGAAHGTGGTANLSWLNRNAMVFNSATDYNSFVSEWDWVRYGGGAPGV